MALTAATPGQRLAFEINGLNKNGNLALVEPNPNLPPKPIMAWNCVASWYGRAFNGKEAANGEVFDMHGFTAAHPTLPLGSIVRVVDLRTKLSQIVRITDRGPYIGGRELDVSYEVARRLGFEQRGIAKVRLELLKVPHHRQAVGPAD